MVVEVALHLLHLLYGSLLGVLLHTRVDGGVYLQTGGVEIVVVVAAPCAQLVCNSLAEVERRAVVVALNAVVELDVYLGDRVVVGACHVAVAHHVAEHDVAAAQRVLGVGERVVVGGGFQHTHEHSRLLDGEILWRAVEVGLRCGLDAEGVATEVDGVGVHGENLVLVVRHLELGGYDPLLRLDDEHAHARNHAEQTGRVVGAHAEHVLGKLLRDGRGAACVVMHHSVLHCAHKTSVVDAVMTVEALVLGSDESLPEGGVHVLELHWCAVLVEVFADEHTVVAVYLRCLTGYGILDGDEARRLAEEPQEVDVDSSEVEEEGNDARSYAYECLGVPFAASVEVAVPMAESARLLQTPGENLLYFFHLIVIFQVAACR